MFSRQAIAVTSLLSASLIWQAMLNYANILESTGRWAEARAIEVKAGRLIAAR